MRKRGKSRCRNNHRGWAAMVSVLIIFLTACQSQPEKSTGPSEKITVAYSTAPHVALFHIAHQGSFLCRGFRGHCSAPRIRQIGPPFASRGKGRYSDQGGHGVILPSLTGREFASQSCRPQPGPWALLRKRTGELPSPDLKGKKDRRATGTTGDFFLDSFLSTRGLARRRSKSLT